MSRRCNPERQFGPVISLGNTLMPIPDLKQAATAFHLQQMKFLDGNFTSVLSGFPIWIRKDVCISCLNSSIDQQILAECSVKQGRTFPPQSMSVGVRKTRGAFQTLALGFIHTALLPRKDHLRQYYGSGDLTNTATYCDIFVIHTPNDTEPNTFYFLEYVDQQHCAELQKLATYKNDTWATTRAPVRTQIIHCKKNLIKTTSLEKAIQIYRSVQLENLIDPKQLVNGSFDDKDDGASRLLFRTMTEDDVYRAALALKLLEGNVHNERYFTYRPCGIYNWTFMIPFFVACFFLLVIGSIAILMKVSSRLDIDVFIPNTSRTWFKEMMRVRYGEISEVKKGQNDEQNHCSPISSRLKMDLHELVIVRSDGDVALQVYSRGHQPEEHDVGKQINS